MKLLRFEEIMPEFVERSHQMVWCDLATVDAKCRPRIRVLPPVWRDGVGYATSLRTGPKANDIDRNPEVSLAYVSNPTLPAYAECRADWVDDPAARREIWEWMASLPEPIGYNTEAMFGSYEYPDLTIMRFRPRQIRLAEAGKPDALRVWRQE
jgi:general stress protein 26